jgi:hypothetical protein
MYENAITSFQFLLYVTFQVKFIFHNLQLVFRRCHFATYNENYHCSNAIMLFLNELPHYQLCINVLEAPKPLNLLHCNFIQEPSAHILSTIAVK